MKKKENKFIEINLAIYRCHCIVTWEQDVNKIIAWGKKNGITQLADDWKKVYQDNAVGTGLAMEFGNNNTDVLVWLKEKPKKLSQYGVLYHELYHAVDRISEQHNLNPYKEIEARAYMFEYLVNECNKILWK